MNRFKVEGFPTLMLCDSQGRPYAESGFPADMSPADMLQQLEKASAAKSKRDAAFAKAEDATGLERAKLLIAALETVPQSTVMGAYGKTIDEIAKLDPDDTTGFVKKAQSERAVSELEEGFAALMEEGKFEEAAKHVDKFLDKHPLEGEPKQKALLFKLYAHANAERFKEAVAIADQLIAIDKDSKTAQMAKLVKGQVEQEVEQE